MSQEFDDIAYEIVKLPPPLSGPKCSFYTVYLPDEDTTVFDKFIEQNEEHYSEALDNILDRIKFFANKQGAIESAFRFEGSKIGEFIHALRDLPDQRLRLYCVRYGKNLVLLGGGGPKFVSKRQEDSLLMSESEFMQKVADDIYERMSTKEIRMSNYDFEGNLIFDNDE